MREEWEIRRIFDLSKENNQIQTEETEIQIQT